MVADFIGQGEAAGGGGAVSFNFKDAITYGRLQILL